MLHDNHSKWYFSLLLDWSFFRQLLSQKMTKGKPKRHKRSVFQKSWKMGQNEGTNLLGRFEIRSKSFWEVAWQIHWWTETETDTKVDMMSYHYLLLWKKLIKWWDWQGTFLWFRDASDDGFLDHFLDVVKVMNLSNFPQEYSLENYRKLQKTPQPSSY